METDGARGSREGVPAWVGVVRGLPELIRQQRRGERIAAGGMFAQGLECLPRLDNDTRAVTLQPTARPWPHAAEAKRDRRTDGRAEGRAAGGSFGGGARAGLAWWGPRASPQTLRGVPGPQWAGGSGSAQIGGRWRALPAETHRAPPSHPAPPSRHQGKYLRLPGPSGSGSSARGHCKTQSTFTQSCSRSGLPLVSLLLLPAPSEYPSPRGAPGIAPAIGKTGGTGTGRGEKQGKKCPKTMVLPPWAQPALAPEKSR